MSSLFPSPGSTSNNVFVAISAVVVLTIYGFFKYPETYLINDPESVASRVDGDKGTNESRKHHNEHSSEHDYDIVIIGGGTAGCVLASRLSEIPTLRVLLIEAGGSSRGVWNSKTPLWTPKNMYHKKTDYNLWTVPQVGAGGVRKYWPRAKLLGGCSSVNAMMFHTCAPSDYDEWAHLTQGLEGASGWAYKHFEKYFRKFEKYIPHPKAEPTVPILDTAIRGSTGPVSVGFWGYFSKASEKWLQACVNVGIPYSKDVNTGHKGTLGVTRVMTYIDPFGRRVNTETAYLTPAVLKRHNLKVVVHSYVTKILFEGKKAVGVEFAKGRDGPRYRVGVKSGGEVVLSAGAVHSPHILLLSGVGPAAHLTQHGIPLVHDLPGVGQRLQDHPAVGGIVPVKSGYSISHVHAAISGWRQVKSIVHLLRFRLFGTGALGSNLGEVAAFLRTSDTKLFQKDTFHIQDTASGPNAPDLETILLPLGYIGHGVDPYPHPSLVTLLAILLRPQSHGSITLNSSDPFDKPVIDPKYLSSPNDVAVLARGLRHIIKVAETEPFASIIDRKAPPFDLALGDLSDAELEHQVRLRVETLYHPVSTCRMAKLEDEGVVDPFLRVYGLENVRVADASVFTTIPSGHTSAPSIAVGEKAADMIKQSLR